MPAVPNLVIDLMPLIDSVMVDQYSSHLFILSFLLSFVMAVTVAFGWACCCALPTSTILAIHLSISAYGGRLVPTLLIVIYDWASCLDCTGAVGLDHYCSVLIGKAPN